MKIASPPPFQPRRLAPKPEPRAQDPGTDIQDRPEFQSDLRRGSLWGVGLGTAIGTGIALALRSPNLGTTVAMALSGALVGGCIAEEQVKLRWGIPIELPSAYR